MRSIFDIYVFISLIYKVGQQVYIGLRTMRFAYAVKPVNKGH